MKHFYQNVLTGLFLTGLMTSVTAQTCEVEVLNDDFSNPSLWTIVGDGSTQISGGVASFVAPNGDYNKIYRDLGAALPDDFWRAETDIHINPNAAGHGTGMIALALTAGNQDVIAYLSGGSYTETNQDMISVVISSVKDDANMNNWFFIIETKKNATRSWDLTKIINLNQTFLDYYLTFERTSSSSVSLSVFTDQARTLHLTGSPISFSIDPTISNLSFIQHGVFTSADPVRLLDATADNDKICRASQADLPENEIMTGVRIVPNPVSSQFLIQVDGISPETISYDVVDASGRTLMSNARYTQQGVSVDDLVPGTYFVHVKALGQTTVLPFVKL